LRKAVNKNTGETQTKVQTVVVIPPACPSCGSTRRGKMEATTRLEVSGEHGGVEYNCVIWRRTHCLDCGQNYIVKSYETKNAKDCA
jgi:hypothetical protein